MILNLIVTICAVVPILVGLWRTGKKITESITTFIEATTANTKAISNLSFRVEALEKATKESKT